MSLDSKWRVALESGERSVPVTDMRTSYDREQINAESDWNRPHDGIHEYRVKIDMVSAAAERTKSSVLEKYGDCISEKQQKHFDEVCIQKYDIYNTRYFLNTKLDGVPLDKRLNILGFHEVEQGGVALKDTDDYNSLRHVTVHETMHALSYQDTRYEQPDGRFDPIENIDSTKKMKCTGVREIVSQQVNTDSGDVYRINVRDANMGINEGLTELYTLRELLEHGEEPGIAAYTQQVKWSRVLEASVGQETLAKAYFNGELDNLKQAVNRLGGSADTWNSLSANIDLYGRYSSLGDDKSARVLDVFAGSGTTAVAVENANLKDNGRRSYTLIQRTELYQGINIADICYKRVQRTIIGSRIAQRCIVYTRSNDGTSDLLSR